jgi:hypothetical protein
VLFKHPDVELALQDVSLGVIEDMLNEVLEKKSKHFSVILLAVLNARVIGLELH